jgi:hypothetical protein
LRQVSLSNRNDRQAVPSVPARRLVRQMSKGPADSSRAAKWGAGQAGYHTGKHTTRIYGRARRTHTSPLVVLEEERGILALEAVLRRGRGCLVIHVRNVGQTHESETCGQSVSGVLGRDFLSNHHI